METKGVILTMANKEREPKKQEKNENNNVDKYSNKYTRKRDEYLAGKPFSMPLGMWLLYVVPLAVISGVPLGITIRYSMHTGIPLETFLLRWEVLLFTGTVGLLALQLVIKMPRKMVLEENGFFYHDCWKKEHKILCTDIISYTIYGDIAPGISVSTGGKKHSFRIDLIRFEYLRDEIELKVGIDKRVKPKFWP